MAFCRAKYSIKNVLKYHVIPSITLLFLTISSQSLAFAGNPELSFRVWNLFGNSFSWMFVLALISWAVLWLHLPFKNVKGPPSPSGIQPMYRTGGKVYFCVTVSLLLAVSAFNPQLCVEIYRNMSQILGTLNIVALSLCVYLVTWKTGNNAGAHKMQNQTSIVYEFFMGSELHPRLLGMDVKQLTSPRLGNMMWQIFNIIFFIAGWKLRGFDAGHFVNVLLQTVYIYKAFYMENYFFSMFEMMEDCAGYYLCWGSLVWMPCFYTFQSYFFVHHPTDMSTFWSTIILAVGLLAIYLNYCVNAQKLQFRNELNLNEKLNDEMSIKPVGIPVKYVAPNGELKQTHLLISGWWGVARKMNYTFELVATIAWSLPGIAYGIWCGLYFAFLFMLLVYRVLYRDEVKCKRKYGRGWVKYCTKVPYRFIPYLF
ncbi:7-dehydrocholesterol reductase [Orchesella cincta]|uniref:7-dehydrocholesterol reductase n=1 Tax=Orchesella cincta TaxID=48709 RepID=A0A1D2MX69_ORCCI|nr:7-dehydrocholesterol reductase [Orchesella cincta]